jgi:hypothetical protein
MIGAWRAAYPASLPHRRSRPGHARVTVVSQALVTGPSGRLRATSGYRVATEVIGRTGGLAPSEPAKGRLEKLKMPPSSPTIRYPSP